MRYRCISFPRGHFPAWLLPPLLASACMSTNFSGSSRGKPTPVVSPAPAPAVQDPPAPPPQPSPVTDDAPAPLPAKCSKQYTVPATANPYFAGVTAATAINYQAFVGDGSNPLDVPAKSAPVLVATAVDGCVRGGMSLSFTVSGHIAHGGDAGTDANGDTSAATSHALHAYLGKSDVIAPINSLLGVFLTDKDPSHEPAPATLDFSTEQARNYEDLRPEIGQIFYIGNGKTSAGAFKKVVVPATATRLYFAIMDGYQWNNNHGALTGALKIDQGNH